MRAVVAPALGEPWAVRDVPDPVPAPGDVLLRVEASGICYSDVHVLRDPDYGGTFPRILGHEFVGTVVSLGAEVRDLAVGERVGVAWTQRWCGRCRMCLRGRHAFCSGNPDFTGVTVDGGHAELAVVDAGSVEPVPAGIDPAEAAPLFCAGYTVYSALREVDVRPGERVAIVGIGGLGHLALQYAKALDAETVVVTRSPGKEAELRGLGADDVVVAGDSAGRVLRDFGGADVILATGNSVDSQILSGLRTGGRLSLVGVTRDEIEMTPFAVVFGAFQIFGSSPGSRAVLREGLAFHARTGARTIVERFSLDEAPEALRRVEEGAARYRIVLVPSS